jgi:hypothetical protein
MDLDGVIILDGKMKGREGKGKRRRKNKLIKNQIQEEEEK